MFTQYATTILRLFQCLMVKVRMVAKKGKNLHRKSKNQKIPSGFFSNQIVSLFSEIFFDFLSRDFPFFATMPTLSMRHGKSLKIVG